MSIIKKLRWKDKSGKTTDYDLGAKASNVEQDSTHRFVSDTEKQTWNGKANPGDIPSGSAANYGVANNDTTNRSDQLVTAQVAYQHGKEIDQLISEISQTKKELSGWEDITEKCNFGYYTSAAGNTGVYKNISLRIVCFRIALTASVSNQSVIATIGELPKNSHPIMLVGSCTHETEGVSVDMRMGDDYGDIISSHTKNVQISNPRYTGIILF